jgi:nitrite reductase/ring-hydroxylating ferredoxin subunit
MTSSALLDVVAAISGVGQQAPRPVGNLRMARGVRASGAGRRTSSGVDAASGLLSLAALASMPVTAAAGAADGSVLHREQQRLATVHAGANVVAGAFVAVSLLQRARGRIGLARVLNVTGVTVASLSAGLGGHLAYRWAAGANHAEAFPHTTAPSWVSLGRVSDLPDGAPSARQVGATPVVVVRRGTTVHALGDACSHLAGPLHEGSVTSEGSQDCIVCPWHASTFRLRDGAVVHGPATAPQPVLETRVVGEYVQARVVPAASESTGGRALGERR